jgi:hypothetical protein
MYCVYLTIYSGNKLPMFYIGSTSIEKIKNGYLGSVSSRRYKTIWKNEVKSNPSLFSVRIISSHDNRDDATKKESKLQSKLKVHKNDLYINARVAMECKYSNVSEYNRTRINPNLGKIAHNKGCKDSEITRKRKSESGKNKVFSKKHKLNLSIARKNRIIEEKTKNKISQTQKNKPRPKTTGAGNGRSKAILFNNKKYESQRQCSLQTGLSVYEIQKTAIFIQK